jgi:hypothetical protein
VESAQEYYRRALDRADELGMRPLAAHCHLGLGKLYRRAKRENLAREHVSAAVTMYHEMGMELWRGEAEAEAAALRP